MIIAYYYVYWWYILSLSHTDQLDGLRVNKKKHSSMEDYLQLPDDYDERKCEPGKKRVCVK